MKENIPWEELKEREQKFYNVANNPNDSFYMELHSLYLGIEVDAQRFRGCKKAILNLIFSRVYDFTILNNSRYSIFERTSPIYSDTFDACFFLALCMFLFYTTRADNMSLRDFIYKHSPQKFNIPGSANYFDINKYHRESTKSQLLESEDTRLRQARRRILSKKPVYEPSREWSGMKKVSEHEWTLYFEIENASENIRKTFNAFKNLHNEVHTAVHSTQDRGYTDRLKKALEKFLNKAQKIKYADFLEMNQFFLDHINKEKLYYGINLYRLENALHLYQTTNEVNQLLECKDDCERDKIILQSLRSNSIIFPKLNKLLRDSNKINVYNQMLDAFNVDLIYTSGLIFDKFIDNNYFDEDWFSFFLETINELAEKVLYNPDEVNYSIKNESQTMFYYVISYPTIYEIQNLIRFENFKFSSESDDDICDTWE